MRWYVPLFLMLGLACGAPKTTVPAPPPKPFVPMLVLRPTGVALLPGATQAFQADLNYPAGAHPPQQPVLWDVIEPGGGTITAAGLYTAPTRPGTYHVEARRKDHPDVRVAVPVVVQ